MKIVMAIFITGIISCAGTFFYTNTQFQKQRFNDMSISSAIEIKRLLSIIDLLRNEKQDQALIALNNFLKSQVDIAEICILEDCGNRVDPMVTNAIKDAEAYQRANQP